MSRARLVITAVVIEGRSQAEVARAYCVSKGWVSRLVARYHSEGEAAFEPRSRRPKSSSTALPETVVRLIESLRRELAGGGLDAGPDTIAWHLWQRHQRRVSRSTVSRYLVKAELVTPQPEKRPKSSYIRFEAEQPNECWQSDCTYYPLEGVRRHHGQAEILTWLDDHARHVLSLSAHISVGAATVLATFRAAIAEHGVPASTLTDNAMAYTARFSAGRGGHNAFESELKRLGVPQKNSRPNHPTTCGKVERFQQTLKRWLAAQPQQPTTLNELQAALDAFKHIYNHERPHRSLPGRCTPAQAYTARPKAQPGDHASHERVRVDRVDKSGMVTLRYHGTLYHIGIGKAHSGKRILLLVQDRDIRIIERGTGELLRHLTLDPNRPYQGTGKPPGPPPKTKRTTEPS